MGFEPDEAAAAMEVRQAEMPGFESPGGLFDRTPILLETVETAPDLSGLDAEVAARVKVETRPDGTVTVAVTGDIPEALEQRLAATVKPERREALRASVDRHRVAYRNSISPAERGAAFAVPRLFLNVQGELQLAEEELILDLGGWTLNDPTSSRAMSGNETLARARAERRSATASTSKPSSARRSA